jgi:hypothetical protein
VEPFLVGTKFGFPFKDREAFHTNGTVSYMKMSDMYDIDTWNDDSAKLHFPVKPLIPWVDFFRTASRNVIYLKLARYGNCALADEVTSYNITLTKIGFKIVNFHCLTLSNAKSVTLEEIKGRMYGKLSPNQATVIFDCWSYMNIPHVVNLGYNNPITGNVGLTLKPSTTLLSDAEQYEVKYLPSNSRYISILVRSEWLIMNRGIDKRKRVLEDCLNRAVGWLGAAMNQTQISRVFVGMDIGKYGSSTLKQLIADYNSQVMEKFLQTAYQMPQMTLKRWEATFTDVSSSEVPGYVAYLQKTVAVHGDCLLLIGFGSFQSHALNVYMKQHQPQRYCYLKTNSLCEVKAVAGLQV